MTTLEEGDQSEKGDKPDQQMALGGKQLGLALKNNSDLVVHNTVYPEEDFNKSNCNGTK